MKTTNRVFVKLCGSAVGAAGVLQVGTCNVQFPPDNTECIPNFGVCIAWGKQQVAPDDSFDRWTALAEVASD